MKWINWLQILRKNRESSQKAIIVLKIYWHDPTMSEIVSSIAKIRNSIPYCKLSGKSFNLDCHRIIDIFLHIVILQ
jgi:hypothetical protein